MESRLIDVRDLDTKYFVGVRAWLDRAGDRYLLPRESAERLGEAGEDGRFYLLDASVVAEPDELEVGGVSQTVWAVRVHDLTCRPTTRPPE